MNKIRVLILRRIYDYPIEDATMINIPYDDNTRIVDIISKCNSKDLKEFNDFDKWLDDDLEIQLRSSYFHNKGKIDWNKHMDNLYIKELIELTNNDLLILRSHGGIGCPDGELFWDIFKDVISKIIYKLFNKLFITKEKAIKIIEEETQRKFDYIESVIKRYSEWPLLFISTIDFKDKKKVEKKIMKMLGYKVKNKKWVIK